MKTLSVLLAALLLSVVGVGAQSRITLTITVTNKPALSDTITINGATRTWWTSKTVTTILTNLVSVNGNKSNLFSQFAGWSWAGPLNLQDNGTNSLKLVAPLNGSLSASASGTWATLSLSTQGGGGFTYTAIYPLENMVSSTDRVNQASSLVYGLSTYSTNAFAVGSTAMSNFMAKGTGVSSTNMTVSAPTSSVLFESNGVLQGSSAFTFANGRLVISSNVTIGGSQTNLNTNGVVVLRAKSIQRKDNNYNLGYGSVDLQYPGTTTYATNADTAEASHSFIGAGRGNLITTNAENSFIGTGIDSYVATATSFIGGGNDLQIINPALVANIAENGIASGSGNVIDQANRSFIGGGSANHIGDGFQTYLPEMAFVGGGANNEVYSTYGAILGGLQNVVSAPGAQVVGSLISNGVTNSVMLGYGPSNVLTVAPSGVGLGTTRPESKFHMLGGNLKVDGGSITVSNTAPQLFLESYSSTPSLSGQIVYNRYYGNATTPTAIQSGTVLASLQAYGYGDTLSRQAAIIEVKAFGPFGDSSVPAMLNFRVGRTNSGTGQNPVITATSTVITNNAMLVVNSNMVYVPGAGTIGHVLTSLDTIGTLGWAAGSGGSGSTQMVAAAIGTLTLSNALNVATLNANLLNLTNALGSNQVWLGMAQLTNVQFTSLAEGNSLFWNAATAKFTNAPGGSGSGSGSTNMITAAIGTLTQTNSISFVVSNQANIGSFLLPAKTNYANAFQAQGGGTNRLGETVFDNHVVVTSNLTVGVMVGTGDHVAVNSAGLLMRTNISGGSGTPGGATSSVQSGTNGTFFGDNAFQYTSVSNGNFGGTFLSVGTPSASTGGSTNMVGPLHIGQLGPGRFTIVTSNGTPRWDFHVDGHFVPTVTAAGSSNRFDIGSFLQPVRTNWVNNLTANYGVFYPSNAVAMPSAASLGVGGHWVGNSNGALVDIKSVNGTTTTMTVLVP